MRKIPRTRKEPLQRLRKERIKTVKGPYEPWYITVSLTQSPFTIISARWECPHCGMLHSSRLICEKHCKGKQGMYGPTCHETHHGGKCASGCAHE